MRRGRPDYFKKARIFSCFLLSCQVLIGREKQFKQPPIFTQVYSGVLLGRMLHGPCTRASEHGDTALLHPPPQDRSGNTSLCGVSPAPATRQVQKQDRGKGWSRTLPLPASQQTCEDTVPVLALKTLTSFSNTLSSTSQFEGDFFCFCF